MKDIGRIFLGWGCAWATAWLFLAGIRCCLPMAPSTPPEPGIFLQGQVANEPMPFLHLSLKIVPSNPGYWLRRRPGLMRMGPNGLWYFTIGAERERGFLAAKFNRPSDLKKPKVFVAPLDGTAGTTQDQRISRMLEFMDSYKGKVRFFSAPVGLGTANSNSFIAAMLKDAGLAFPKAPFYCRWLAFGYGCTAAHFRVPASP